MVLVGTHLPSVVALYASNSFVHFSLHALWVVAAVVFWFPVLVRGAPFVAPLQPPTKIVYLVAATVAPTVPASFLKRTETAFYPSDATAPRVWGFRRSSTFRLLGS
jgi:hypothetical protein